MDTFLNSAKRLFSQGFKSFDVYILLFYRTFDVGLLIFLNCFNANFGNFFLRHSGIDAKRPRDRKRTVYKKEKNWINWESFNLRV